MIRQPEFVNMLPLVCNDAAAILFTFDLSRIATLNNVKEWYPPPPPRRVCVRGFKRVCASERERLCV